MTKTEHCSLNQWEADDPVRRTDFNEDNAKIDAAIHAMDAKVDGKAGITALAAVEAKLPRIVTGTYTGTGGTEGVRRITLPGRPKAVLIHTENPSTNHYYRSLLITDICIMQFRTTGSVTTNAPGNGYGLEDSGFTIPSSSDQNDTNMSQYYLAVI